MFILGDFSSQKKKGKENDTEDDIVEINADDFEDIDDIEVVNSTKTMEDQEND